MEAEKSIKIEKYYRCKKCHRSIQRSKLTRISFSFVCIDKDSCRKHNSKQLASKYKKINELDDVQFHLLREDFL